VQLWNLAQKMTHFARKAPSFSGLSAFTMLILCYFSGRANSGGAEQAQQVGKIRGTVCTIYP
jgi:hypothetical protein